jgi:hypothetical protein
MLVGVSDRGKKTRGGWKDNSKIGLEVIGCEVGNWSL